MPPLTTLPCSSPCAFLVRVKHAKMQKLGECHGRAQATATQQAFVRSEKTFDTV